MIGLLAKLYLHKDLSDRSFVVAVEILYIAN